MLFLSRRCLPVEIASLMDGALYLHDCTTTLSGNPCWKWQGWFRSPSPTAMFCQSFAGFVSALHEEIMVNVDRRWTHQFYVNVVIVPFDPVRL